MQKRTFIDYFFIALKGVAMGAADVVPGVSGGTIAFISGIYEELLQSINNIDLKVFSLFKTLGVKGVWKHVNGNFLLALICGIGASIASLAKLISWLLVAQPILVWSFFFGLVLASILYIGKQITNWSIYTLLVFGIGATLAYWITTLQPLITENTSLIYLFFAGSIAICAMILPGISGAFILVLLGAYKSVLEAIHSRNVQVLLTVGIGAIAGLLTFSKVLSWLFSNYKNLTLAVLSGFVLGSLNKIWPWKEILTWRTNSHGEQVPLLEKSILPSSFNGDPQLIYAILLAFLGFATILILEKIAVTNE